MRPRLVPVVYRFGVLTRGTHRPGSGLPQRAARGRRKGGSPPEQQHALPAHDLQEGREEDPPARKGRVGHPPSSNVRSSLTARRTWRGGGGADQEGEVRVTPEAETCAWSAGGVGREGEG